MEADPAVKNWIELEDEAEAEKARARMIRRVSAVMDPPLINLTEASAYHPTCSLSPPPTSPVSHAGHTSLVFARARAPTHLVPMGPRWDPKEAMDCSEDAPRGADGKADSPSSNLSMLFTQHSEEVVQEPHNECVEAVDLPATQVLTGDRAKPLDTHHLCPRTEGVVASGPARTTGTGLVADVALEGPMRTGDNYPHDMGCPSGGDDLASSNGPADTPLPPMIPPYALPDEWLDVYATLAAIPSAPTHDNVGAHPSNLLGCGSFSECVERARVHAVKIDIDAIESTARSLLDDGLGVDQAIMAGHISTIRTQGMGQALKRMSAQMLPSTLHPRNHLISDPPERHSPLPVQQHPSLVVKLTPTQQAVMEAHCDRITPPPSLRSSCTQSSDGGHPAHPGSVHTGNDI